MEQAITHPRLKRLGLNHTNAANYRPVANLPFLSKLLERMVNKQFVMYLAQNGLMLRQQLAYQEGHSTEMTLLRIFNYIINAIVNEELALL